jgi:hypothetical protein
MGFEPELHDGHSNRRILFLDVHIIEYYQDHCMKGDEMDGIWKGETEFGLENLKKKTTCETHQGNGRKILTL